MENNMNKLNKISMDLMYCRFALQTLLLQKKDWEISAEHLANIHNEEINYHEGKSVNVNTINNAKQFIISKNPVTQVKVK